MLVRVAGSFFAPFSFLKENLSLCVKDGKRSSRR